MLKVAFSAVGCKLNQYEIQVITEALEPYGFQQVPFNNIADLYIINTCTVTGKADYTSRQMIRRALRKNPNAKTLVTGCYAQLEPATLKKLGSEIFIIDNKQKDDIPKTALNLFGIKSSSTPMSKTITTMTGHSRAFIKIQEGCIEKCTYCIIWKARGKPSSREPEQIINEINSLYENGYKEVVLTGVHIGKYKKRLNFSGLLKKVLKETDMPRIRLSSLKPDEFKDELMEIIAVEKRICPHVHLPIQSGDDEILKRMGRKYSAGLVSSLTNRLVKIRPDITIGADFIVGFPGETDINFNNTISLVNDNPIHHLHVFSYSDRPGTPASQFNDKVAPEVKSKRSRRLHRTGNKKKKEHMQNFVGLTLDVIVEDRLKSGKLTGVSGNYLKVEFSGDKSLQKKHIEIIITSAKKDILMGNLSSIKFLKNS